MPRRTRVEPFLTLGALPSRFGTSFRVQAPGAAQVELLVETGEAAGTIVELANRGDGVFETTLKHVRTGDHYRYRVDGRGPFPDPASRHQPSGVHGPSTVVDPHAFSWTFLDWRGVSLETLILYELHVGTFTPEGTFAGVIAKLPHLKRLGVTGIELLPVHDFPGDRNWGYDAGALFAPARCYGAPDDLRRLVDAAHGAGIAVILDVVYNHLGPDGAYVAAFQPQMFSRRHKTPWGRALNFDAPGSEHVRRFFVENALHWLTEYRFDGLRLDATHAIHDASETHFLRELSARVEATITDREVVLIAEDGRNLNTVITPAADGGYGIDADWSFDFHHHLHRMLTGERASYFKDFNGSLRDLATIVENGWLYTGQPSKYHGGKKRGTSARGIPPKRFLFFTQTHDETGNRPFGERMSALVKPEVERAATALLLLAPEPPMLFMGQEWGASTPFHFFTDHGPRLGARITEGRRNEFASWPGLRSAASRARIPDPQSPDTFVASRLDWDEPTSEPFASLLRYYRALIDLRRKEPALRAIEGATFSCSVVDRHALVLTREAEGVTPLVAVFVFDGAMRVDLARLKLPAARRWSTTLTSEDPGFTRDPRPMRIVRRSGGAPAITFRRAGCWVGRGEN